MAPAVVTDRSTQQRHFNINLKHIAFTETVQTHFGIQICCVEIRILQSDSYILPVSNRPKEDWLKQILERFPSRHKTQKNQPKHRNHRNHKTGGNLDITRARKSVRLRSVRQQGDRDHRLHVGSSTFLACVVKRLSSAPTRPRQGERLEPASLPDRTSSVLDRTPRQNCT